MHVFVNGWFWGNKTSGSGQYLDYLLYKLAGLASASDLQITLAVPEAQVGADNDPLPEVVSLQSIALPPLPRQLAKLWWEQISMPRWARRLGADVLWVPYWAAPVWQPIPTAVTIHDIIPHLLPAYRMGQLQRLYTSLVSSSARRCAYIITVSESSKCDVVEHLYIDPAKVIAILSGPNQTTAKLACSPIPDIWTKYGLPHRYFLYLGGFDVRKNVESVLQAYERYLIKGGDHSIKLVVAGQLPRISSDFFPDPQQVAARLGIEDSVYFCGFVDDEDKAYLYRHAVGYLFPSLYEGFGMTIIEAMNAGAPTITSQRGVV